jgi:hypothetical protein
MAQVRVRAGDWMLERLMTFERLLQASVLRCQFKGLAPDGPPMVTGSCW